MTRSPVTRIDYKVVVMNADSSDVAVDEPDMTTIITDFGQASLQVCNCLAYKQRNIGIVGKVKTSDKNSIEKVIKSAWEAKNQGQLNDKPKLFSFSIQVYIDHFTQRWAFLYQALHQLDTTIILVAQGPMPFVHAGRHSCSLYGKDVTCSILGTT